MNRLFTTAIAVVFFAEPCHADTVHYSYAFSKQYVVSISDDMLEASPSWKDDAENPPLSARKALTLATEMKDTLVKDTQEFKWALRSCTLQPADGDKWYWLVRYEAEFQGASTGRPNHLRLVVLMDGLVIKPSVRDHK